MKEVHFEIILLYFEKIYIKRKKIENRDLCQKSLRSMELPPER